MLACLLYTKNRIRVMFFNTARSVSNAQRSGRGLCYEWFIHLLTMKRLSFTSGAVFPQARRDSLKPIRHLPPVYSTHSHP